MDYTTSLGFLAFLFIMGCCAAFRVGEMWVVDDGPFDVFHKIRVASESVPVIGKLLQCFYCSATWAALLYTIWIWSFISLPLWLAPVWWFSVTGGASTIYRIVRVR